jgi:hypothetical protein
MAQHKLTHGEQVARVLECVVADLDYQVMLVHMLEKLLLCLVAKEFADV